MARTMLSDGRSFIEDTIELRPLPDKPAPTREDFEAKRKADSITLAGVLKQERWDVDHLNLAITMHGYPRPVGRVMQRFGLGLGEPTYSRSMIEQWRARFLAFADSVKR